jgi:hypothetical protein
MIWFFFFYICLLAKLVICKNIMCLWCNVCVVLTFFVALTQLLWILLFFCCFPVSFRENQNSLFAKTFAKVSCFRHVFFAKTKIEFRENFREKTKAKTFVPTLHIAQNWHWKNGFCWKDKQNISLITDVFYWDSTPWEFW